MLAKLLDLTPEGSAVTEPCPRPGCRRPSVAGPADDRRPADLHPEPSQGTAGARESGAQRCGWPAARSTTGSARCRSRWGRLRPSQSPVGADRAVAFAELSMTEVRTLKARLRIDDQRRGAGRVLRRVAQPLPGRHTARMSRARWSPWSRCRCATTRTALPVGNQLSAMFVPLANDKQTPLERLRTVTVAKRVCARGRSAPVGYGPLGTRMTEALPPRSPRR